MARIRRPRARTFKPSSKKLPVRAPNYPDYQKSKTIPYRVDDPSIFSVWIGYNQGEGGGGQAQPPVLDWALPGRLNTGALVYHEADDTSGAFSNTLNMGVQIITPAAAPASSVGAGPIVQSPAGNFSWSYVTKGQAF